MAETDPVTPHLLDRHPAWDTPSTSVVVVHIHQTDIAAAMDTITTELVDIRFDITALRRDFYGFMDLVTTNIDHLFHSRASLLLSFPRSNSSLINQDNEF
ncbi:unnamed protein product [Vicia faba]|uniref:Uncharacterized protein n=1 Tax=Vicia faba TaxID=3906 RepID=A0AAV1A092_VICFA|nr:unnamed protein product [Vicia faba]